MREHVDGDFPFANDFNAIVQALADDAAVVSGCSVSDGGTDDMTVSVASGSVRINGSKYSVGSQSVTLSSSDPDYDRYDLVVVDDTGSAGTVTGTASMTPTAPSIPTNSALLAVVHVAAGVSGIIDGDINGARAVFGLAQDFADHAANASAHHDRPSAGTNMTEDDNGNFNVADNWLSTSEILTEDGTFTAARNDWAESNPVSVSFTNTYQKAVVGVGMRQTSRIYSTDGDIAMIGFVGWNTDSNGNITGADFNYVLSRAGNATAHYTVLGV